MKNRRSTHVILAVLFFSVLLLYKPVRYSVLRTLPFPASVDDVAEMQSVLAQIRSNDRTLQGNGKIFGDPQAFITIFTVYGADDNQITRLARDVASIRTQTKCKPIVIEFFDKKEFDMKQEKLQCRKYI
jgi:hypothetical protein